MHQSPSWLAHSLSQDAALGVLFVALFAAASPADVRDLVRRPDALLAMTCLLLNLGGLFACAAFATATGQQKR
jgi:hypothetical protein